MSLFVSQKCIGDVIQPFQMDPKLRQATFYASPKQVVRGTRKIYKHGGVSKTEFEILLKIGRPNYQERKFIKVCQKAGEPFPLKKLQLKFIKK